MSATASAASATLHELRERLRAQPSLHRLARRGAWQLACVRGTYRRPRPLGDSLRILVHVPFYVPDRIGGAEQSLRAVIAHLTSHGHRCVVLDESGSDRVVDGVPVRACHRSGGIQAAYRDCDVVLTQHRPTARKALRLARAAGRPVVYFVREAGMLPEVGMPDLVVFNSEHIREREADRVRAAAVVPPSVDPDRFRTTPGEAVTLINLSEDKGAPLLFRLARELPDTQFLGVRGTWGQQLVPPPGLANLTIAEPVDDVRDIYSRTRVLLMPSRRESFGRVALEAASSGIPTVAHPTAGLVESLGPAGIFVHREDHDGWYRALGDLRDPDRYRAASAAARSRSEHYRPGPHLVELERRLRGLAGGTTTRGAVAATVSGDGSCPPPVSHHPWPEAG